MRLPPPKLPPATNLVFAFQGPRVPEGTYTYKVIKGKESYEGRVDLVPDPRSPHSAEDRQLQQKTALDLYYMLGDLTYLIDALIDVRDQSTAKAEELGGKGSLAQRLEDYADEAEKLRTSLVSTAETGWISGDEKLREKLGNLFGDVVGFDGRPTESQLDRTRVLAGQLETAQKAFAGVTSVESLSPINKQLEAKGLEPIAVMSREAWEAAQEPGAAAGGQSARQLTQELQSRLWLPLGSL
jgi:hypothetical protein